eukprot:85397-Pyramimonas_sp.AAC.1
MFSLPFAIGTPRPSDDPIAFRATLFTQSSGFGPLPNPVLSHRGVAIGRCGRYILIEGLRLVSVCDILSSTGCDWSA